MNGQDGLDWVKERFGQFRAGRAELPKATATGPDRHAEVSIRSLRTIRQRVFPSDARAQWPADDDPAATDGLAADDVKTARHHQQNTENRGRSR